MRTRSGNCPQCGTWREFLARDHIVPKWKFKRGIATGYFNSRENIQYICDNCHADKTRQDKREWRSSLTEDEKKSRNLNCSQKNKGRQKSPTERARLSEALKGKKFTPERRANISAARKGRPWTEARRAAVANGELKGRVFSEAHKAALRAAWKTSPLLSGRKGRPLSPEHKEALRKANANRQFTPEHRAALSIANKKRIVTPEWRAALKAGWIKRKAKNNPPAEN